MFKVLFNVVLPILLGGYIYISFRSESLLMFSWFKKLQLYDLIIDYRSFSISYIDNFPEWFYYSLPDGLWMYSITSSVILIWNHNSKYLIFWLCIIFFLGVIIELLQFFQWHEGTFDVIDLFFVFIAFLLSLLINYKPKKTIYETTII